MQEEEERKMKIGQRGPCDCVHDLQAEKKEGKGALNVCSCCSRSAFGPQPQLPGNSAEKKIDRALMAAKDILLYFPGRERDTTLLITLKEDN